MIATPRRARPAFTLVELLVTIGIIMVLLGILMPTIISARRQADRKRTEADLQVISQALEAYKQVFNDYPRQIRPDWNITQPARMANGPERVLAKYLLGWDPLPDPLPPDPARPPYIDGQGVRVVKVVSPDGKKASNKGKKWGPYLPPDRFKFEPDVGDLDNLNNIGAGGKLKDRYDSEIQYYPKWNSRTDLTKAGSILGSVTRGSATSDPRALFNLYDGIAYNGNDFKSVSHLDHLLYMLGDGPDVADGSPPSSRIYPQQGATISTSAAYPNNKIDTGETLAFTGDFILVSAGPDKVWGLNDLYDPSNTSKTGINRKRSKVDDVYNIPPR